MGSRPGKALFTTSRVKQKMNVRESWDRFLEQDLIGHEISAWTLAMPWNPSREALQWLQGFPPATQFAKTWMGRTKLDVLAADNPHSSTTTSAMARQCSTAIDRASRQGGRRLDWAMPTFSKVCGGARKRWRSARRGGSLLLVRISVKLGQYPWMTRPARGSGGCRDGAVRDDRRPPLLGHASHPDSPYGWATPANPPDDPVRGAAWHPRASDAYGLRDLWGSVSERCRRRGRGARSSRHGPKGTEPVLVYSPRQRRVPAAGVAWNRLGGATVATLPLLPPETSSGFTGERFWLTAKDPSGL